MSWASSASWTPAPGGFAAPNVQTREEAQLVADDGRYPPQDKRSLGSGRFSLSFNTDPKTYFERANEEILRVVQIEHIDAVKRIDEIFSVPGIHTPAPEAVNRRLAKGWLMVGCTSDMSHLMTGARATLAAIKRPQ